MILVTQIKPGSTVAVFGAGGVGLAAVLGAKKMGASKLIVVDTNPKKFDIGKRYLTFSLRKLVSNMEYLAKKLGATQCVNPNDYHKPINEVLVEMADGVLDYTIDCTGSSTSTVS